MAVLLLDLNLELLLKLPLGRNGSWYSHGSSAGCIAGSDNRNGNQVRFQLLVQDAADGHHGSGSPGALLDHIDVHNQHGSRHRRPRRCRCHLC